METTFADERLRSLIFQMPAPLALLVGPEHRHQIVSAAYPKTSGGGHDVLGLTPQEAFPELAGQGIFEHLDEVYATGEPWVGSEVPLRYDRDGTGVQDTWFNLRFEPVRDTDGRIVALLDFAVDVTDQVRARCQAERLLAESERARQHAEAARERMAGLQALTAALSMSSTVDEIAEAIVVYATGSLGAAGTVVARLSDDGEHLELLRASEMSDAVRDAWSHFPVSAAVPLADVVRTREPIFLESRADWSARYPELGPLLDATGHQANVIAPLIVEHRVLGVLGAAFKSPRTFDADDRAAVLTLARQCAQALDRARLFEAERVAREQAEAANRAKSEFLAVMSHELRTPLNAIGGYAELIEIEVHGPVTPEQRTALERLRRSQRHLLNLIEGVLNFAKVDAGAVHYAVDDVRLDEVLTVCEALTDPQVRQRQIDLRTAGCEHPVTARADAEKVQQVVLNLLSNAVKFTELGGRITMDCGASGDGWVVVRVSDTGGGIAPDQLDRVFEPFVQVDATLTRTKQGTGLGLAISRQLARGMGGDLLVESVVGIGSTFTLILPAATTSLLSHQ